MWVTNKGLMQERITDPHTGLEKIVSVKLSGKGEKARQDGFRRLQAKIEKMSESHIRLSEAIRSYTKETEKTLKPSSVRKNSIELAQVLQIVGDAFLENLTAGYIRTKLLDSGKSNRTLNGYLKHFKTFWGWCYRNDYVKSKEVIDKLTLFQDSPKKSRITDKYLEPKELTALLDGMTEKRWRLMTEFLTLSGMRIGEVIALDKKDVWGDIVRIYKTYDANNHVLTDAKTLSSKRDIYIQAELKECIERINEYMEWQKEVCGYETDIFFPDLDGSRLKYYSYSTYLRENSEKILGRRITPHVLRHTHCSMLASKGMSLEAISERLGHEDSRITKEIYLHKLEEVKAKERRQLDSIHLIG